MKQKLRNSLFAASLLFSSHFSTFALAEETKDAIGEIIAKEVIGQEKIYLDPAKIIRHKTKHTLEIESAIQGTLPFLNSNEIYVSQGEEQIGLFAWNNEEKLYFQLGVEEENLLLIEPGKPYHIVLSSQMNNQYVFEFGQESSNELQDIKEFLVTINVKNKNKIQENHFALTYPAYLKSLGMLVFKKSGYFVVIDKHTQNLHLMYYDMNRDSFMYLGRDVVSTGNEKRTQPGKPFMNTPNLITTTYYKNSWTADGKGQMGFGRKGFRIFYLGKYRMSSGMHIGREITMAMHATTDYGKVMLGKKMSSGCIRMSDSMNTLLDKILKKYSTMDVIISDSSYSFDENIAQIEGWNQAISGIDELKIKNNLGENPNGEVSNIETSSINTLGESEDIGTNTESIKKP